MRTNPSIYPEIFAGIARSEQTLQQALLQLSTGKRVNVPSDDPSAAAALVQVLGSSAQVDSYQANVNTTLSKLQTADSVLSSVVNLLNQAVSLGTEAANGTESSGSRGSIAVQIEGILSSVVSQANTTYQGTALFAGTSNPSAAFSPSVSSPTVYTYNGNSSTNEVVVGDTLRVQGNIAGSLLFTNTSASVLGSLSQLASSLTSGSTDAIASAVDGITSALNFVSEQHAIFGNSINQLTSQESFLSQEKVTLSSQQNALVEVDPAVAATQLTEAEAQNSAVLAASAKVLPVSLLDYLH